MAAFFAAGAIAYTGVLWTTSGTEDAEPQPAVYGLCDVFFTSMPPALEVQPFPVLQPDIDLKHASGHDFFILLQTPMPEDVVSITDPDNRSRVAIEPETGEIVFESYRDDSDRELIGAALKAMHVGLWEPAGPAWPKTDAAHTGELVTPDVPGLRTVVTYRRPDDASGFIAHATLGSSTESSRIKAYTCDSSVTLNTATGELLEENVVDAERPTFDRFLSEISEPMPVSANASAGAR